MIDCPCLSAVDRETETHMRRATVTLSDELENALEEYRRDQGTEPSLDSITETALRDFLLARGYLQSTRPLRLTPAEIGSGDDRGSIDHDQILARRSL